MSTESVAARPSIRGRAERWLPWTPLIAGPALLFGPALLQGRVLFWGTPLLQFTPWRTLARQMLSSGSLPLWNPWLGMGAPLFANYQSALLYPPNWLLLVVDVAWGQTLLAMLHLMAAGIGMALLCRHLGLDRLAQSVAGLAFGLSGYLVARAGFLSINATAAWLPWIILAAERLIDRDRPVRAWDLAGLSLALAAQWLAGHAQISWYTLLFTVVWVGYRARSAGGSRATLRALLRFSAAGGLAFLIAAVQLLPTLEYLSLSDRSVGVNPELAMTYSFWPWRALGLLTPDIFGNPRSGEYWGYGNFWEDAIYIGTLPFLMAVSAAAGARTPNRLRWFLVGTSLTAVVFALGKNTPLFPWLYDNIPSFSLFQAPTRWNLLLTFSLALLAGYGVNQWGVVGGRGLYWLRLGTAGAAAMAATAWAARSVLQNLEPTFAPSILLAGIMLVVGGLLALSRRDPPSNLWISVTLAVVLLDLLLAGRGLNPTVAGGLHRKATSFTDRDHRLLMPPEVEQEIKFEVAFRFDSFQPDFDWMQVREVALPNTGVLSGLRSANNFDPILPARYVSWLDALFAVPQSQRLRLLRAADVGWLADSHGNYQPLTPPERAWFVSQAQWVSDTPEALNAIAASGFDPFQQVVLEGEPRAASGGSSTVVDLREPGPNRLELTVTAPQGGWLVVADSWYPGWEAIVDGRQSEIYPANAAFRAVWIPAGGQQIVMRYRPPILAAGSILSGMGVAIVVLIRKR